MVEILIGDVRSKIREIPGMRECRYKSDWRRRG